ncbi:hypothetical protein LTR53_015868 [Teratosphaeriaceae sp. CCFEE 6253]|nr:hypothetical protein LTR53_015868 [Teratosphaeriaceae sp. CCFEE 6253]
MAASAPRPPDVDIGPMMVAVACAFLIPAIITTSLRLWIRAREQVLGLDDAAIGAAAVLSIALSSLSIVAVKHGKGRHAHYLRKEQIAKISELSWVVQIVLFCALCLVKISVCLLVLRIKNTRPLRRFLYGVMALLVVTTVIPIIALCIECRPLQGFWHREMGHCHSPNFRIYSIYVQAAYSVTTDLLCSLLPILIVWNLQLALHKKVGVCVMMCMGLMYVLRRKVSLSTVLSDTDLPSATIFAAVRAASLSVKTTDTTYAYAYTGTWMIIEANLGIMATNIPPLRGVVNLFRRRVRQYSRRHSRGHASRTNELPIREYTYGSGNARATAATEAPRPPSSGGGSDQSEIPLKSILHTRTYDVTDHDPRDMREVRQ